MKKRYLIIGICLMTIIITGISMFYFRSATVASNKIKDFNKNFKSLAIFTNETEVNEFPTKESGYNFLKVTCDNNSTGAWDATEWKLTMSFKGPDQCNIYFSDRVELFSGDLSSTASDDVTFHYYDDGSVAITGEGAAKPSDGLLLGDIFGGYLNYDTDFVSTIAEGEFAVMGAEYSYYLLPIATKNYKTFSKLVSSQYETPFEVENYTEYVAELASREIITDPNFYTLAAKFNNLFPNDKPLVTSITIDEGITAIEEGILSFWSNIEFVLPSTLISLDYSSAAWLEATIDLSKCSNLETIGEEAFIGSNLNIIWPTNSSITSIGDSAFQLVTGTDFIIPNSVETIGKRAFMSSTIDKIVFPNNVNFTTIDDDVLSSIPSLNKVIIPTNVTTISPTALTGIETHLSFVGPERVLNSTAGGTFDLTPYTVDWNYTD